MSEKLEEMEIKLGQMSESNVVEGMTIFSIKEQKSGDLQIKEIKEIKDRYSRKRNLFQSLTMDKAHQLRYTKRKYSNIEEEPDVNLNKVYSRKIYSYLHFLCKVRYSNNIPMCLVLLNERFSGEKVKVYVGKGNNRYLIMALLRRRFWLEICSKITV